MANLDLKIGNVKDQNDSLFISPFTDLVEGAKDGANAALNTVIPSVILASENTAHTSRNWGNLLKGDAWKKFLKSFPSMAADIGTKAVSLPFRTIEGAMTYVVSNNVERVVKATKGATTGFLKNWITNNGETNYKVLKGLGGFIGGAGDVLGSIAKAPFGGLEWLSKQPNKWVFNPAVAKTQGWVESQRISEKNFFGPHMTTTSDYRPGTAANDNNIEQSQAA